MLINREDEMIIVNEALDDLKSEEHLIQTPMVDFYGIPGIGKSALLIEIIRICHKKKVPCITTIAEQDILLQNVEDVEEVIKGTSIKTSLEEIVREVDEQESHRDPLVIVIDDIGNTEKVQIADLENFLNKMVNYNNLFIALASRRKVSFDHQKKIRRKMTVYPLQPFDRKSSQQFLERLSTNPSEEQREQVYQWTHGYPLAMKEMAEALKAGSDLTNEQERNRVIEGIVDRVIVKGLLAGIEGKDLERFHALLGLLAFPRRFNLVLMRHLIERFEGRYGFSSSLAYMTIPREITEATGVLDWSLARAGFSIEEPVRGILLLEVKISDNARYKEINTFLATLNWEYALEVQGQDRIRYLLEFFYHRVLSTEQPEADLRHTIRQIMEEANLSTEQLVYFRAELTEDRELLEALDTYAAMALNLVNEHLSDYLFNLYEREKDREKRASILYEAFLYQTLLTERDDIRNTIKSRFDVLLEKENPVWLLKLYERLSENDRFIAVMGELNDAMLELLRSTAYEEE